MNLGNKQFQNIGELFKYISYAEHGVFILKTLLAKLCDDSEIYSEDNRTKEIIRNQFNSRLATALKNLKPEEKEKKVEPVAAKIIENRVPKINYMFNHYGLAPILESKVTEEREKMLMVKLFPEAKDAIDKGDNRNKVAVQRLQTLSKSENREK